LWRARQANLVAVAVRARLALVDGPLGQPMVSVVDFAEASAPGRLGFGLRESPRGFKCFCQFKIDQARGVHSRQHLSPRRKLMRLASAYFSEYEPVWRLQA